MVQVGILDLYPSHGRHTVHLKVTLKSQLRPWFNEKGSGLLLYFDCMDQNGDEIRVCCLHSSFSSHCCDLPDL